ncbi:MAG: DUF2202 domain-containing protein [Campylobacterota bacterium]|nr:DUF2202 domain-containing protein [Campylobacterota bacterium]
MKTNITLSLLTAILLVGCGGSSTSSNTLADAIPQESVSIVGNTLPSTLPTSDEKLDLETQTVVPTPEPTSNPTPTPILQEEPLVSITPVKNEPVDITVERGPVVGAYVSDSSGKRAYNISNGTYRFNQMPSYPIYVYGGYIDVNRDGVINENDTKLTLNLSLNEQNQTKVTLLTTLAQNEELKYELMESYGLSQEELYGLTPSESLEVASISDELYRYCMENNETLEEINLTALQSLREPIQTKIQYAQTLEGDIVDIVTQNEIDLMNELEANMNEEEVIEAQQDVNHSAIQEQSPEELVNTLPISSLTQAQIDGLLFMYQEEKVARDLYLKLYEVWGLTIFNNIAASEQTHMNAVATLLEKYKIAVPVENESYGEFALEELQELYDALIVQGSLSSTDALEVGKLVEETDIADLQERLVDAPEDIAVVYNSLLSGSYSHLDAFSSQLDGTAGGGNNGEGKGRH